MDINQYYADFCDRVDRWAEEREKRYACVSKPQILIERDDKGKQTRAGNDACEDMTLEFVSRTYKTGLRLEGYKSLFEMRLFDLAGVFEAAVGEPKHPDNLVHIYARADGFAACVQQMRIPLLDDNLQETFDNDGDTVMHNEVTVMLCGTVRRDPGIVHVAQRAFNAMADEDQTDKGWRFLIRAERDTGRIIDTLSPFMVSPWEKPIKMLTGGVEHLHGMGVPFPDELNDCESDDPKWLAHQTEVYTKSVLLEIERSQKLPPHIRQMMGYEPFVKDPEVFKRSSANAAYLVHYVPQKLRI